MEDRVMQNDHCPICGAPIPEGRQVCWSCEHQDSIGREAKSMTEKENNKTDRVN